MTEKQKALLKKIGVDINADVDTIEEAVGDYLNLHYLDKNYKPNEADLICESILDSLA